MQKIEVETGWKKLKFELVRHFEVDHNFTRYKSSQEVVKACNSYNNAAIKNSFPIYNSHKKVYISSFSRTKLTAEYLINRDIIIQDPLLNELTMNPIFNINIRLPIMLWFLLWRICWFFNIPLANETRRETELRAKKFIDKLEKNNENITVVGHALIFKMLIKELKSRGYKGQVKPRFFSNGELREFTNE